MSVVDDLKALTVGPPLHKEEVPAGMLLAGDLIFVNGYPVELTRVVQVPAPRFNPTAKLRIFLKFGESAYDNTFYDEDMLVVCVRRHQPPRPYEKA